MMEVDFIDSGGRSTSHVHLINSVALMYKVEISKVGRAYAGMW